MSIQGPSNGHCQVDFVIGTAITRSGPARSYLFYMNQGRLISIDNE